MKEVTTDHRLTTRIAAGLAAVALIVHLLTIDRYGYFRDELYYIACARDFVDTGTRSICAKMDLARWFDRICHRASKHHLANRTQLAHLGVVARYRAEPQERRPHTVGVFLATNHLDESDNLSAVVWRIDLVARFPRRPALSRHRFHLPDRASRIHRHAREELLSRSSLSDVVCRGWRRLRKNFRTSLPLA